MTLIEVISKLNELDESKTIYLRKPWSPDSPTVVATEPDEGGLPREVDDLGLSYFIEVVIAREFFEDWSDSLPGSPNLREKCARLIQYALNDA